MHNNEYWKVGLYDHNIETHRKVKSAYDSGENIVGIVQATGTGKTYLALQVCLDFNAIKENKDKKTLWVVPSNSIIEHIKKTIEMNPNLDMERDFPNLEFRTYQSFINMSKEELSKLDCDMLILDEFHHLGAPVWGSRINTIIDSHPNIKVFGMTAYTVRDRGTPFERDMANPNGGELFSGKIVSRYDLVDAMLDGVLPSYVIYRTAYIHLLGLEKELEEKVENLVASKEEIKEYKELLKTAKKRIAEAPGIEDVAKKYVKANGKYFYFCPPRSEEGTNDINTIMKEAYGWFSSYVPEEDIVFYCTTSEMGDEGKHNRDMFYNDLTLDGKDAKNKLRIMFSINQYAEGTHAPNVDGVIMGRGTSSDILYFELLGRGLAVRGNTYEKYNEYDKYSYDELVFLAKEKEIDINEDMSKEDIIDKLVSPLIIDLSNNIAFIKELQDNIKDRIKERREKGEGTKLPTKLRNVNFDIDILNDDLYETLSNLRNRIYRDWDSVYELAKKYYEHYGNLKVKQYFKTLNGYDYDENGINLGTWIGTQRASYKKGTLSQDKTKKLKEIGMIFRTAKTIWNDMFELAKNYYEEHGDLNIPEDYEAIDPDGEIVDLRRWVLTEEQKVSSYQKNTYRRLKLEEIGIKSYNIENDYDRMFELVKNFYSRYGHLNIPFDFKTTNGYDYHKKGADLGSWLHRKLSRLKALQLKDDEVLRWKKLQDIIPFKFGTFDDMYSLAKIYFDIYRNLDIPSDFTTTNGFLKEEDGFPLGRWISYQKMSYSNGKLDDKKKYDLELIGVFDDSDEYFNKMYDEAKKYYEKNGDLLIDHHYINPDNKCPLGAWLYYQKHLIGLRKVKEERYNKLKEIGVTLGYRSGLVEEAWYVMWFLAKNYFKKYGTIPDFYQFRTLDGINDSIDGYNLGVWCIQQLKLLQQNKISKEKIEFLDEIGITYNDDKLQSDVKENNNENLRDNSVLQIIVEKNYFQDWRDKYKLLKAYYDKHGNIDLPKDFRTINGYDYVENGFSLYKWLKNQMTAYRSGELKFEKYKLLKEIGLPYDLKSNLERKIEICNKHGLNYNDYPELIDKFNHIELICYIYYLTEHGVSLMHEDKPHEIFLMNSKELKKKYNISKEIILNFSFEHQKNNGNPRK